MTVATMSRVSPADVQGGYTIGSKRKKQRRFASWLEPAPEMFSLEARPVFAVGKWKGQEYTAKDLKHIVEAFEPTLNQLKPRIKLGHDNAQGFANGTGGGAPKSPGTPALGFVSDVYLNDAYPDRHTGKTVPAGTQVLADFANIPRELYEALVHLSYPERSVELLVDYADTERPGTTWPLALKAVAFLGDELPAVRGLPPLVELFDEPALTTITLPFKEEFAMSPIPAAPTAPAESVEARLEKLEATMSEIMNLVKAKAPDAPPDEKMAATTPAATTPAPEMPAAPTPPTAPQAPAMPQVQVVNVGKPEDLERRYTERLQAAEAKASAAQEAVNVMHAANQQREHEAECRAFVEALMTDKNNRIPAAKKNPAVYLLANAPNGQTRTFSEGAKEVSYAEVLRSFMAELPDRSDMLSRKTLRLSAPTQPTAAAMADRAHALAKEKGINFAEALTTIVQAEGEDTYNDAVHGGGH